MRDRPRSFVEEITAHGYQTYMFQADDNDGPVSQCDRGFDHVEAIYDFRVLLQNFIVEVLLEECQHWEAGVCTDADISELLHQSFGAVLGHLENGTFRVTRPGLSSWVGYPSNKMKRAFHAERMLLERDPIAVARKILTLEPHFYHLCLGQAIPENMTLTAFRIIYHIGGGIRSRLVPRSIFPFRVLTGHTSPVASQLLKGASTAIKNATRPWFIFAHVMDIHDRRQAHGLTGILSRMAWYPKWARHRKGPKNVEQFLYDSALAKVDREVGKLIGVLKRSGQAHNTVFLVSADHGCEIYDALRRGTNEDFGWRTHPEHIDVPLICGPTKRQPTDGGLLDSMSFSATVLDLLGISQHSTFKGFSAFAKRRNVVITENAGRGNANILDHDLYFTITTQKFKAMAILTKNEFQVHRLYDCEADVHELQNIVGDPKQKPVIDVLIDYVFEERFELLSNRGVNRNSVQIVT